MNGDLLIDVSSVLPYLEQKVRGFFGKDAESEEWARKIRDMTRMATEHAAYVQCVGMHTPIPIQKIYQPSRLRLGRSGTFPVDLNSLSEGLDGAVVFAGPGQGKTMLLHSIYTILAKDKDRTPVLFTLRWEGAPDDLVAFVDRLSRQDGGKQRLVLLVDGYDEITVEERQAVSKSLLLFQSLQRGPFLLTCRTFYDVYDLQA